MPIPEWTAEDFRPAQTMAKEDLVVRYKDYLTVGKLKKFLEKNNMPDDAPILIERIFDWYYDKNDWKVYPKMMNDGETVNSEYTPAFCAAFYTDDPDILFLNLHY